MKYPIVAVTDEAINPSRPNVIQQIQNKMVEAEIERHKAALAEVTTPEFAEWAYRPTAFECWR